MRDWIDDHVAHLLVGFIMMIVGYFEPIKGVVHLVVLVSMMDFFVGIYAAKVTSIAIQSKKMWRTVEKIFLEILIISLLYCMDREVGYFDTHKFIAWFIVGIEIYSIIESLAKTSDHRVFRYIKKLMQLKIKEKTGIDVTNNRKK